MMMKCDESLKLIGAYVDHELDLKTAIAVEKHAAECEKCSHALEQAQALKQALRNEQLYYRGPDGLRARIANAIAQEGEIKRPKYEVTKLNKVSMSWFSFGLSLASVAVLSLTLSLQLGKPSQDTRISEEIISSHVRSLMEGHLTDVVSTDQHTVKPWFAGRLDYSPPVGDFSSQGYPLVGGRVDYIGHRPVSTLIYRHNKHIINVYIWPESGAGKAQALSHEGFNLIRVDKAGMVFWAVSDLNAQELKAFSDLL